MLLRGASFSPTVHTNSVGAVYRHADESMGHSRGSQYPSASNRDASGLYPHDFLPLRLPVLLTQEFPRHIFLLFLSCALYPQNHMILQS